MPGLAVAGNRHKPLVPRHSHPCFMFMLCGINNSKKETSLSCNDRMLIVARRGTEILNAAAAVIEKMNNDRHWTLGEIWQAALRDLSEKDPKWKRPTAPKAPENVMDILIKARIKSTAAERATQVSSKDIQRFLEVLDKFINIQSQHKFCSHSRHQVPATRQPRPDQEDGDHVQNHEDASIGGMGGDSDDEKLVVKPEYNPTVPDAAAVVPHQPPVSPNNMKRIHVLERDQKLQRLQEEYDDLDEENDDLLKENDKLADHCDELEDTVWDYQRWLNADERTIRVQEIMLARNQQAMRRQHAEIQRLRQENALLQARSILRDWAQYQEGRRH
ncbi:hypothetical protein CGCSCA5_v009658 [Colletotrichum siamense]|nr:hypothetical protein CGCSCA5_v009658 [Colletotrichum siamense]KAF4867904.1 hypothetical protein CGCSCA1_v012883 [Colletotrichum siamense]